MDDDDLGGRLPLLHPEDLDTDQRELAARLHSTRVHAGQSSGYVAELEDGRLVGPFNAMLRNPAVSDAQLDWVQAISASGLATVVRETVILTIAAAWGVPYVAYAHSRAGAAAGLSADDIDRLLAGEEPTGVSPDALTAHRLARAVVVDHHVTDDFYADALTTFGEPTLVALIALMGQYLATSAILTCFDVPAPE